MSPYGSGDSYYQWRDYKRDLDRIRSDLKQLSYDPFVESESVVDDLFELLSPKKTSLDKELFLLPREFEVLPLGTLLRPIDIPELPTVPKHPPELDVPGRQQTIDEAAHIQDLIDEKRRGFERARDDARKECVNVQRALVGGDIRAAERVILFAHQRHPLPKLLRKEYRVTIDSTSKIALVDFAFPDYSNVKLVVGYTGRGYPPKPKYASPTQTKKYVKQCLYSLIVRSAYLAASFCPRDAFSSVVINVDQDWHDPATGAPRHGLIASLQAPVDYLRSLDLSRLDPEACFRNLKGIATPSLQNISAIRPIFVLSKDDDRFVVSQEIDDHLNPETNLAAMPWEDFEHLVAQLFEWEFQSKGIEVRVTRASRDRGVDAILFDPDPLRGGKYVIQAKRYTRTVDVSAVRDLYGTLMNEGANRGILITTSSYGPDAYEFVKDKPISLVDGPNLILMLQKHGKKYRIDLEEARRLDSE